MSSVRRVRKRAQALVFGVVVLCCCAVSLPRLLSRSSSDSSADLRASIVLTAYETTGLRPDWLREICERYTSPDYAQLVREVVLVWNNPAAQLPPGIPPSVKVIRSRENSLNNRWLAAQHVDNPVVLAHDNDLVLSQNGIRCLLNVWRDHPDRLIGPYARQRVDLDYILDDLVSRPAPYHFVLPRALVGASSAMAEYGAAELSDLRDYVDTQAAHCDDLLLNLVVADRTQLPPLRVALPPASVNDYATVCSPLDRTLSSGLADQGSRAHLRTACMQHFLSSPHFSPDVSSPSNTEIAVCSDDGGSYSMSRHVSLRRWREMENGTAAALCPELAAQHLPSPPTVPTVGLRAELEEYCPAVDRARIEWIDALVDLGECGAAKDEARDPGLVPSAQHQCGAWCVWDLRQPTRAGWRLHAGDCWERFEEGHAEWCDEWFWQRPRFDLDDSEDS
ncbi:hypothetical protein JCM8208_007581 [Rhodotorula glutinis]